jgi:hypothetical protein
MPLDSELVIEDGQILCTKNPTGHAILIDYKFELPKGKFGALRLRVGFLPSPEAHSELHP